LSRYLFTSVTDLDNLSEPEVPDEEIMGNLRCASVSFEEAPKAKTKASDVSPWTLEQFMVVTWVDRVSERLSGYSKASSSA
jgi:hypothetical protein